MWRLSTNTLTGQPVAMTLPISGSGAGARIITQRAHGTVGLNGSISICFPDPGFVGTDTFIFAAWDGSKNSDLATGTLVVAQGPFSIAAAAYVPPSYPAAWSVPFAVVAAPSNLTAAMTYDWDFGDGSTHGVDSHALHSYALPGTYPWTVIAKVQGPSCSVTTTNTGNIVMGNRDFPLKSPDARHKLLPRAERNLRSIRLRAGDRTDARQPMS